MTANLNDKPLRSCTQDVFSRKCKMSLIYSAVCHVRRNLHKRSISSTYANDKFGKREIQAPRSVVLSFQMNNASLEKKKFFLIMFFSQNDENASAAFRLKINYTVHFFEQFY